MQNNQSNQIKPYHVALNLNTDAIGWATLDDQFKPLKVNDYNGSRGTQKHLAMGVHKFEPGKTAVDRRLSRSTRRTLSRRKKRLKWLNDIFEPYLNQIDPEFLHRLKYSNLAGSDKLFEGTLLFPNPAEEKQFYTTYPTIYHLRYALMSEHHKFDLRLIYLAIHHIVKYRGHFFDKTPLSVFEQENTDYSDTFAQLQEGYASTNLNDLVNLNPAGTDAFVEDALDNGPGKREKKTAMLDAICVLGVSKIGDKINKQVCKELIKAVLGEKFTLDALFQLDSPTEVKLCFADEDFDAQLSEVGDSLSNEQLTIVQALQKLYSSIALQQLVPDGKSFSEVQIESYNRWHKQYKTLTAFRKQVMDAKLVQQLHSLMDRYGSRNASDKGRLDHDGFQAAIKKAINDYQKAGNELSPEAEAIMRWIDQDNFMVKQRTKSNQLIPHQLHQLELDRIIDNQAKYYPFLKKENPRASRRANAKYRLDELVAFHLPYYLGPLVDNRYVNDDNRNQFAWMVRKSVRDPQTGNNYATNEEITPWNFEDQVDLIATAQKFIRQLTTKDSYLLSEDVLPKASLLYQRHNVLNELNKIKVDGDPLRVGDKHKIFTDLFRKHKTVTVKMLKKYLIQEFGKMTDPEITGLADPKQFNSTYSTYIDLAKIIGDEVNNPDRQDDLEQIIEWSTIFPEGGMYRTMLNRIDWLNDAQRNKLANLHYSGWGRLSKRTLSGILNEDGERVIDVMWNTNLNFAQVMAQPDFKDQFTDANEAYLHNAQTDFDYVLENTYTSPQNKKAIRRAIMITDDIVSRFHRVPDTISVSFPRQSSAESYLSVQRATQMKKQYREITKETAGKYFGDKKELEKLLKNAKSLSKKQQLFFAQYGRDLYTGLKINYDQLGQYNLVHILPPAFVNDDSLNNLALVKRGFSQPMNVVRNSQRGFWHILQKMRLLTYAKERNLMTDPKSVGKFAKESYARHQLSSQSQIVKLVATFLSERYGKDTKVITVRDEMVSQLKHKYGIDYQLKINDFINGQSAFLTGLAGLYLYKNYPNLRPMFVYGAHMYNVDDIRSLHSFNFLYHLLRKEDDYTVPDTNGLSADKINSTARKTLDRAYMMFITEKPESRHDQIFKATIFPRTANKKLFPLKKDKAVELYGGYTALTFAYLALLKAVMGDEHTYQLVPVPRFISDRVDSYLAHTQKEKAHQLIIEHGRAYLPKKLANATLSVELPKVFFHEAVVRDNIASAIGSAKVLQNTDQLILSQAAISALESNGPDVPEDYDNQLLSVYDEIVDQVAHHMPLYHQANLDERLASARDNFAKLPATQDPTASSRFKYTKQSILRNLIYSLQAGPHSADLRAIGLVTGFGRVPYNPRFNAGDEFILTSPTGLFKSRYLLD